jgi:hypothetical protein
VRGKSLTSAPAHDRDMTTAHELSRLLAAGGRRVRILLTAARPGYARLERQAFGVSAAVRYRR